MVSATLVVTVRQSCDCAGMPVLGFKIDHTVGGGGMPAQVSRQRAAAVATKAGPRSSVINHGISSRILPRGALALSVCSTVAPVAKGYSNARDVIAAGMAHTTTPASDATNCNITAENR